MAVLIRIVDFFPTWSYHHHRLNQITRIMNKNIIVLILLIATSQLMGQDEIDISKFYPIEASHSYVGFSVKYMGYAQVRGRFETFQGTVYYDELDIKKTSISFSIDVGSIDTDLNWRDRDLKSANWFNADTFPKITFISKKVVPRREKLERC